jgi:hypothetical protein
MLMSSQAELHVENLLLEDEMQTLDSLLECQKSTHENPLLQCEIHLFFLSENHPL